MISLGECITIIAWEYIHTNLSYAMVTQALRTLFFVIPKEDLAATVVQPMLLYIVTDYRIAIYVVIQNQIYSSALGFPN